MYAKEWSDNFICDFFKNSAADFFLIIPLEFQQEFQQDWEFHQVLLQQWYQGVRHEFS